MPSTQQATAYIALGSNLGDRRASINHAIDLINRDERTQVIALSPLIETAPVGGPPGQGQFLNAACEVITTHPPRDLLNLLLTIERQLGRQRRQRWGPRPIDLDLLLYADAVIDQPDLTIPHPRMHQRPFVLDPLATIAPNIVHPLLNQTIAALRSNLQSPIGQKRVSRRSHRAQ